MKHLLAATALLSATSATAQDAEWFVRDNTLAIFYHEFGHALIDLLQLPIYGQEEDAADVASVMLMHFLYEEDHAAEMVMSTADNFYAETLQEDGDIAYWGVHGINEQRYYNTLCIFFGGNPDDREDMIHVMGLPEERAETCPEEFDQADYSWGNVFRTLFSEKGGNTFKLNIASDQAPLTAMAMQEEVDALNAMFVLPQVLPIEIAECGEANAFYDPGTQKITMCTEFEAHLESLYEVLQEE